MGRNAWHVIESNAPGPVTPSMPMPTDIESDIGVIAKMWQMQQESIGSSIQVTEPWLEEVMPDYLEEWRSGHAPASSM